MAYIAIVRCRRFDRDLALRPTCPPPAIVPLPPYPTGPADRSLPTDRVHQSRDGPYWSRSVGATTQLREGLPAAAEHRHTHSVYLYLLNEGPCSTAAALVLVIIPTASSPAPCRQPQFTYPSRVVSVRRPGASEDLSSSGHSGFDGSNLNSSPTHRPGRVATQVCALELRFLNPTPFRSVVERRPLRATLAAA